MRFALVFTALLLSGCLTPCPPAPTVPETHSYTCEDGSELSVTFNSRPGFAYVVQEGFGPLELPTDVTSAGFRYAEDGAELRGQGVEARWTRPGAAETECRQAREAAVRP